MSKWSIWFCLKWAELGICFELLSTATNNETMLTKTIVSDWTHHMVSTDWLQFSTKNKKGVYQL